MKKIILISVIIIGIFCGGFFYLKNSLLKTRDFKPDNSKAKTVLDLRPAIIAKLQQAIKDGSQGLYILSVKNLEPDLLASKLDVMDGTISIDTVAMQELDKAKKLPDDVFHINFHSLHIDGIGIRDLLNKKNIDIRHVFLSNPEINIYHRARPYNKDERKKNDSLTVYQRLMGEMKRIAIAAIDIKKGTLIIHDVDQPKRQTRFNDISIRMDDVLIDSSTQYDDDRFLFAKHAVIETRNYTFPTPDSLYFVKLGRISLTAEKHTVTVFNAQLQHRGTRKEFEKKLTGRDEIYDVMLPKVVLSQVNWWNLVNREKILSETMTIYGGTVSVFTDKSLPLGTNQPMDHFPHQLVMMIPVPVLVNQLNFQRLKVIFQQYNPETRSIGEVICSNITGVAKHITNIPGEIKRYPYTLLSARALFMNRVPLTVAFKFDLAKYRTGQFSVAVHMDSLDKNLVNPISEPLGRFTVKRGQMQQGTARIEGDNFKLHGTVNFYYDDLHITPLGKDSANDDLKKSHLKSFFANIIFIKNANPQGSEFRQPVFDVGRDHHQNFVGYIWTAILTGLCKTIGIPVKLVIKNE